MKIVLMRHAEAEALSQQSNHQDAQRALTERGVLQARQAATQILENYNPDLIVVSPYLRAQQTAAPFTQALPYVRVLSYAGITPDDAPLPALDYLSKLGAENLLVVSHMNVIARLAAVLCDNELDSFELAEGRLLSSSLLLPGLATEQKRWYVTH